MKSLTMKSLTMKSLTMKRLPITTLPMISKPKPFPARCRILVMRKLVGTTLGALCLVSSFSVSSLSAGTLLEDGYRHMYNLQFAEAHKTLAEYMRQQPEDPMGPVADGAAYLYSEFDRLRILQSELFTQTDQYLDFSKPVADPKIKASFMASLEKGKQLIDKTLQQKPDDGNALFAATLRLGLRADYLAMIERKDLAALDEVKQSRLISEQLLKRYPDYYDAYIAVGVENYLLSLRAAPVRWLLKFGGAQTDRQTGLDKLRLTAEKGHYLLPYAKLILAVADIRAKAPAQARQKLEWLSKEFPLNRLYREELAKLR